MTPSLPVPTDNIYKFSCLFGLTLIVASIFSFVSTYTSSLDQKIKYTETIIPLEAKTARSKAENDILELNKRLVDVAKSNQSTANAAIGIVLAIGTALSIVGGYQWHQKIQLRDDRLAQLQIEKLEAEIALLHTEIGRAESKDLGTVVDAKILAGVS